MQWEENSLEFPGPGIILERQAAAGDYISVKQISREVVMKAVVDAELCTGCGLCADISPKVFTMKGEVAVAIEGSVPPDVAAETHEAKESCPVEAIEISQ